MPSFFRAHRPTLALILVSFLVPNFVVAFQDTVVVRSNDGNGNKVRKGQITDWIGNKISLLANDRTRTIDIDSVVDVQTRWPSELTQARELISRNQYREAIASYESALSAESREWVKQIVLSELIQTLDAVESPQQTTRKFLQLYQLDKQTRFFHLIPLPWSASGLKSPAESETAKWMAAKNSLLRLLGASWQLSGTKRGQAVEVLEQLASDTDTRIAQLATAQLWRTRVLSAAPQDIERWQIQIENIDSKLRAGPLLLLAEAQQRNGMKEKAQLSLLKVPILHPEKKSLAAFALFRCGSIREDNNGDTNSQPARPANGKAAAIWRELIRDHPTSQYAELARGKL